VQKEILIYRECLGLLHYKAVPAVTVIEEREGDGMGLKPR
jgi:hypothetical protein